jgi:hypothetical protein
MELKDNEYSLAFDKNTSTATMKGSLRLASLGEYEKVKMFLNLAAREAGSEFTMDMRQLDFLNSSGVTTISTFVIMMRKENKRKLKVLGSKDISWQDRSLKNLLKLWDKVELELD